jgi:hypothetical protein
MNKAAFVISLVSLVLGTTAYWRSGGKQDIQALGRVARAIAASYDKSRQRLQVARNHLRQLKEEAVEGLEKQVQLAQEQLETLARGLEEGAKSAKDATATAARNVEQAIALRVRRIEARTTLLQAKAKASRAVSSAAKKDFERADQLLADATELLRNARETLGDDHSYDQLLEAMKVALREATTAVRAHAENVRQKIEQVLTDTDRIVSSLESDEDRAAKQAS